jgi:hypothetical protein
VSTSLFAEPISGHPYQSLSPDVALGEAGVRQNGVSLGASILSAKIPGDDYVEIATGMAEAGAGFVAIFGAVLTGPFAPGVFFMGAYDITHGFQTEWDASYAAGQIAQQNYNDLNGPNSWLD